MECYIQAKTQHEHYLLLCSSQVAFFDFSSISSGGSNLASFPGLPCLYLPFVFTIVHGSGRFCIVVNVNGRLNWGRSETEASSNRWQVVSSLVPRFLFENEASLLLGMYKIQS